LNEAALVGDDDRLLGLAEFADVFADRFFNCALVGLPTRRPRRYA
jgi:hypothetical protein